MEKKFLIIVLILVSIGLAYYFGFWQKEEISEKEKTEGNLKIEILRQGSGEKAEDGDTIAVHYTGILENGTKFDSSLDRGTPFTFVLGAGQVIKGWDQGVWGMKPKEKRKLTIAPELGYGKIGIPGAIPQNATLIFEVELIEIISVKHFQ